MDMNNGPHGTPLSRRAVLLTATTAGVAAGLVDAKAAVPPAGDYGAPLVELHVPTGVLTLEQKAAMITGITDVLLKATQLPPDRAQKLWVQIFETAEGGWGLGGSVFVPRAK
jgi:4-oxalocrotonate tautomerase